MHVAILLTGNNTSNFAVQVSRRRLHHHWQLGFSTRWTTRFAGADSCCRPCPKTYVRQLFQTSSDGDCLWWRGGGNPWRLEPRVKKFTTYPEQRAWRPSQAEVSMYSVHHQQVTRLLESAEMIGHTCLIAAFWVGGNFLISQYHPEMILDFLLSLIDEMTEITTLAQQGTARVAFNCPAQGALFAHWIKAFFIEAITHRSCHDAN
ncbi:MAG: hypothetical protein HRT36_06905 [Alphaproteobacteria bacterium]|nr:hypothetical protein [Alphaproteobacteria bacterium]